MSFHQEGFPDAEHLTEQQLNGWIKNAEMPDLIGAPEHSTIEESSGFKNCGWIIGAIAILGGVVVTGMAGYWAYYDECLGNRIMDFFQTFCPFCSNE